MINRTIILHLSLIDDIGSATIQKIVTCFSDRDFRYIYSMSTSDLISQCGLLPRVAQRVVLGLSKLTSLEKELDLIESHQVRWVTILDPEYPPQLKEIHLPPPVLYWFGSDLNATVPSIAVVGTRIANQYGHRAIISLIPPLVNAGFCIVSGGALGADSMAHRATLSAGGVTVVVLGSGLLQPYPQINRRLFEDIIRVGGIVLSPFHLSMKAVKGNFPARNRIIAGLSRGCVVVQAAEKSGALITAGYALDQGREVFALPGCFDDVLSSGCHALIRQGAQLIISADQILEEFGHTVRVMQTNHPVHMGGGTQDNLPVLTSIVDRIMHLCLQSRSLDELLHVLQCDTLSLQEILFDLQMDGKIQQDFTGKWISSSSSCSL